MEKIEYISVKTLLDFIEEEEEYKYECTEECTSMINNNKFVVDFESCSNF